MIDPAIVRSGRFDRLVENGSPDLASIVRIIEHAVGKSTRPLNLRPIADQLLGSSGAVVTAMVRQARGMARRERKTLEQCHLEAAAHCVLAAGPGFHQGAEATTLGFLRRHSHREGLRSNARRVHGDAPSLDLRGLIVLAGAGHLPLERLRPFGF